MLGLPTDNWVFWVGELIGVCIVVAALAKGLARELGLSQAIILIIGFLAIWTLIVPLAIP